MEAFTVLLPGKEHGCCRVEIFPGCNLDNNDDSQLSHRNVGENPTSADASAPPHTFGLLNYIFWICSLYAVPRMWCSNFYFIKITAVACRLLFNKGTIRTLEAEIQQNQLLKHIQGNTSLHQMLSLFTCMCLSADNQDTFTKMAVIYI